MVTSKDPDQILKDAAAGSHAAFKELVQMFDPRLKAYCRSICWPPVDFEEVAQIVWIEVHQKLDEVENAKDLLSLLITTARRRAIDQSRRLGVLKNAQTLADCEGNGTEPTTKIMTSLEMMIHQERTKMLQECMDSDNPAVQVFVLKHLDELSYDEIAAQLGIPEGTIASRISRGKEAIQKCMEGKLS